MPTLRRAIETRSEAPSEATIFARQPWTPESEAVFATADAVAGDLVYLLEVGLAREVLEVWSSWRGGRTASADEAVGAVL